MPSPADSRCRPIAFQEPARRPGRQPSVSELAFELNLKAPARTPSIDAADFCSLTAVCRRADWPLSPKAQSGPFSVDHPTLPSPRSPLSSRWSKLGRRSSAAILGCCIEDVSRYPSSIDSSRDAISFTCRVEELAQTPHSGRPNALPCKGASLCPNKSMKKNRKLPGF
jgi:hypothetical protein